jgi:hypothetical protein
MDHAILDWLASGGDTYVRIFGGGPALVIGPFIAWSASSKKMESLRMENSRNARQSGILTEGMGVTKEWGSEGMGVIYEV